MSGRIAVISNRALSSIDFRGPLISEVIARGVKVFVFVPDYDKTTKAKIRSLGAEPVAYSLSRTGMNPLRDSIDVLRLSLCLSRFELEAVLSYSPKPVVYGTLAAWLAQVPRRFALITGLGYAFALSSQTESFRRRLLKCLVLHLFKFALRGGEKSFFQNMDDLTLFIDSGVVRFSQAIRVNGTGVNLNEWLPHPHVINPITFILVARLLREKGIVEYVEAAKRIRAFCSNARFILLGGVDSNPGALAQSEVNSWVEEGLIEWPGHVQDVRSWLAKASVFVLPSFYREGVPRSTQEAMAMARPIITTDAPGCRETVIEGVNGFLVPPCDVDALVRAMIRFIERPELIERMGKESRKLAEARFDIRKINQKMLQTMGL